MAERVPGIPPTQSVATHPGVMLDGNGRFVATVEAYKRGEEVCRLRSSGWTWRQIAEHLEYADPTGAYHAYQSAIKRLPSLASDETRQTELEHLEFLRRTVMALLEKQYVTVSNGRVVYLGDKPIEDTGPILAAVDRLLKIEQQIADLTQLRTPSAIVGGQQITYAYIGVDVSKV